MNIFTLILCI